MNHADFENLFKRWAEISVKGLDALKAGQPARKTPPAAK
jgi:hypothetical protein